MYSAHNDAFQEYCRRGLPSRNALPSKYGLRSKTASHPGGADVERQSRSYHTTSALSRSWYQYAEVLIQRGLASAREPSPGALFGSCTSVSESSRLLEFGAARSSPAGNGRYPAGAAVAPGRAGRRAAQAASAAVNNRVGAAVALPRSRARLPRGTVDENDGQLRARHRLEVASRLASRGLLPRSNLSHLPKGSPSCKPLAASDQPPGHADADHAIVSPPSLPMFDLSFFCSSVEQAQDVILPPLPTPSVSEPGSSQPQTPKKVKFSFVENQGQGRIEDGGQPEPARTVEPTPRYEARHHPDVEPAPTESSTHSEGGGGLDDLAPAGRDQANGIEHDSQLGSAHGPEAGMGAAGSDALACAATPRSEHGSTHSQAPSAASFDSEATMSSLLQFLSGRRRSVRVDGAELLRQRELGPQSRRGGASQAQLGVLEFDKHAQRCFEQFARNEEEMCGEWAVFYHSYSYSAVIYELHAAIAAVLFQFPSEEATLPRLLVSDFERTPDAASLIEEYQAVFAASRRDHHPRYRQAGISAMCSLVALGPEVSTPTMFLAGFSQYDLSFSDVLGRTLESCHVPRPRIRQLAADIVALSELSGLDVAQYGGRSCESLKAGHLLQIFIKRPLIDKLAYAAKPYGEVDEERHPLSQWLNSDKSMSFGQARVVVNPKSFMSKECVRMNVASADPTFHKNRPQFQEQLIELIEAAFDEPDLRQRATEAIYGGILPAQSAEEGGPVAPTRGNCSVQ